MSRIVRFAKWVRKNPKKSIFFGSILAYTTNYAVEKRRIRLAMRAYCKEAEQYGERSCPSGKVPRHVTVLMNTHAKGGKSLYEEYAAPLLHLSGAKVAVFKTEHAGQAKDLMQIMDNTDAVLVVGGDGTLMEAVTGLLNREDKHEAVKKFPMGTVPTGRTNTLAHRLYYKPGMRQQELAAEATMAVIRGIRKPIDAFRVDFHNEKLWERVDQRDLHLEEIKSEDLKNHGVRESKSQAELKTEASVGITPKDDSSLKLEEIDPVFGVAKLETGIFRDIDAKIDKYWYFGSLRARAAYFFAGLRSVPLPEETEIQYSDACSGCNRCMKREIPEPKVTEENKKEAKKKWWSSFEKKEPAKVKADPYEKYANIVNDRCGQMLDSSIYCTNVEVHPLDGALVLEASPYLSSVMFDGFDRHSKYVTPSMKTQLKAGKISFDFPQKDAVDPSYIPTPEEKRSKELLIKGKKMTVDSEVFARQPVTITLFRDAINFFATS